jgi:hypothetical protein
LTSLPPPPPQSSLHQISSDIEGLKNRLQQRALEFEHLSSLKYQSKEENRLLKQKLQEMEAANNREKQELEENLNSVIHNSKSHLAAQQQQFTTLQTKLGEETRTTGCSLRAKLRALS